MPSASAASVPGRSCRCRPPPSIALAAVGVRRGSATMSPPASAARTRWVRKGGIVSAGLAPRSSTACADPMSVTGKGSPRSRPKHRMPAAAAELMHQRPL